MPQRRLRGPRISGCSQGPVTRPALTIASEPPGFTRRESKDHPHSRENRKAHRTMGPNDASEPEEMRTYRILFVSSAGFSADS